MSNPLHAPRETVVAPPFPDGTFVPPDGMTMADWNEKVKDDWQIKNILSRLVKKKEGVAMAPSVLMKPAVRAGMVFNDGAKKRLLAITQDAPLQFRVRSRLATEVKNAIIDGMPTQDVTVTQPNTHFVVSTISKAASRAECIERTTKYFMVTGGTQWAMGRLMAALPEPTIHILKPVTRGEANEAYEACGFYHGSPFWEGLYTNPFDMDAYGELWPLVRGGEGLAVSIAKSASLGHPYYAKASDDDAFTRCLQMTRHMMETWRGRAGQAYREAILRQPSAVLFTGKVKTDIYKEDKIKDCKLRFYVVAPGHLKFYLAMATQPFAKAKVSLTEIFAERAANPDHPLFSNEMFKRPSAVTKFLKKMHSAQKVGLTGNGPFYMVRALDVQVHDRGYGYLHCGDDTWLVVMGTFQAGDEVGLVPQLNMFKIDMTNFDLTQRRTVVSAVHDRLAEGLAIIDKDRAEVMSEIWKKKLINVHASAICTFENLGVSGITLQSEVNDMIAEVCCNRLGKILEGGSVARRTLKGRPCFDIQWPQLEQHVRNIGLDLGLIIRIESQVSYAGPDVVGARHEIEEAGDTLEYAFEFPVTNFFTSFRGKFSFLGYVFAAAPQGIQARHEADAPVQFRFTNAPERISVFPDLPRALVNLLYPNRSWVKGKAEFDLYNAIRVQSSLMNWGCLSLMNQEVCGLNQWASIMTTIQEAIKSGRSHSQDLLNSTDYLPGTEGGEADAMVVIGEAMRFSMITTEPAAVTVARILNTQVEIFRCCDEPRRRRGIGATVAPDGEVRAMVEDPIQFMDPGFPGGLALAYENVASPGLTGVAAREVVQQAFGVAWADEMDAAEGAMAGIVAVGGPVLPAGLRAVSAANFGRPPPNVPVTNPLNPTGMPGQGGSAAPAGGAGQTATQKRRARKQRKRARESEGQRGVEQAGAHFDNARAEEQAQMDMDEEFRRAMVFEDQMDRMARDRGE